MSCSRKRLGRTENGAESEPGAKSICAHMGFPMKSRVITLAPGYSTACAIH